MLIRCACSIGIELGKYSVANVQFAEVQSKYEHAQFVALAYL